MISEVARPMEVPQNSCSSQWVPLNAPHSLWLVSWYVIQEALRENRIILLNSVFLDCHLDVSKVRVAGQRIGFFLSETLESLISPHFVLGGQLKRALGHGTAVIFYSSHHIKQSVYFFQINRNHFGWFILWLSRGQGVNFFSLFSFFLAPFFLPLCPGRLNVHQHKLRVSCEERLYPVILVFRVVRVQSRERLKSEVLGRSPEKTFFWEFIFASEV